MKSWSEHRLLRLICQGNSLSYKVFPYLREDHFTTDSYNKAFQRIQAFFSRKGTLLSWQELVTDSALPEKVTNRLRAREIKRKSLVKHDTALVIPKDFSKVLSLLDRVTIDAQKVHLIDYQRELTEKLSRDKPEEGGLNSILSYCNEELEKIANLASPTDSLFKFSESTPKELLSLLPRSDGATFIPTGFKEFDSVNLGLPRDSLLLISANTGGGKSTLARQLGLNTYSMGGRVCIVSLEMSYEENLARLLSNVSGVPSLKLVSDVDRYRKAVRKCLSRLIKKAGKAARFDFYVPEESDTIPKMLSFLAPNRYDMIIVDYVSLAAPMHKDVWRSLDLSARYSKIFATKNRCVVGLLAQWDAKEDQVRYARALQEHASNAWKWIATQEHLDAGYLDISQAKARNQRRFDFKVSVDWPTSRVSDYVEAQAEEQETEPMSDEFDTLGPDADV